MAHYNEINVWLESASTNTNDERETLYTDPCWPDQSCRMLAAEDEKMCSMRVRASAAFCSGKWDWLRIQVQECNWNGSNCQAQYQASRSDQTFQIVLEFEVSCRKIADPSKVLYTPFQVIAEEIISPVERISRFMGFRAELCYIQDIQENDNSSRRSTGWPSAAAAAANSIGVRRVNNGSRFSGFGDELGCTQDTQKKEGSRKRSKNSQANENSRKPDLTDDEEYATLPKIEESPPPHITDGHPSPNDDSVIKEEVNGFEAKDPRARLSNDSTQAASSAYDDGEENVNSRMT
ncbi:hypothetical protein BC567DRAFT_213355 [Phyllosticta citribraziliensis]